MAKSTPAQVYKRYFDTLQAAVNCVTHGRLVGRLPDRAQLNKMHSLVLGTGDPVPLKSPESLAFSAGHLFRIIEDLNADDGPFRATTIQYWYQFATSSGTKLLTYHWTPETTDPSQRKHPHLHIENGIIDPHGPFTPDRFSRYHIPTGRVSLEAVVRFSIEELGVEPIRNDWNEALSKGQDSFMRHRRRGQEPRE